MSKEYENQNVSYVIHGNYHLPCITVKEQNELHIGVWANRHRQYLKQHHRIKYYNLLTSERLYPYVLLYANQYAFSSHLYVILQRNTGPCLCR